MLCFKKQNRSYLLICLWLAVFVSCIPDNTKYDDLNRSLSDPEVQRLYTLQDRQDIDSILWMTSDEFAVNRLAVAKSFASIKDERAIDSLILLLTDPVDEVKIMAAYALGQSYNEQACTPLIDAFINNDSTQTNTEFNMNILEAVGKVCADTHQKLLATVKTYTATDDKLLKGQSRALYRFALRGITSPQATELMVNRVQDKSLTDPIRLIAAHYLSRAKSINIDSFQFRLVHTLERESNPDIRQAVANALSKTKDPSIATSLINQLDQETDYRVKCNIINSLSSFPYQIVAPKAIELLTDKNPHVALTAANYFYRNGIPQLANNYSTLSDGIANPRVKAKLLAAANRQLAPYYTSSRARLRNKINGLITNSDQLYDKVDFYKAQFAHPLNFALAETAMAQENNVIQSNIIMSIGDAMSSSAFPLSYRTNLAKRNITTSLYAFLQKYMIQGDPGVTAAAASVLSNPGIGFNTLDMDHRWMDSLINTIKLPQEIETYKEIRNARNKLGGNISTDDQISTDHQINWANLQGVSDSTIAKIITNQGEIIMELYPSLAPGSVSNFIDLATNNYYDNKVFHRVVPNFVIQGGCPRGDGYGSLDYTIRSELGPIYYDQEGMVGMASAGRHTEGTQFFITHSPAMHLDGSYTIFGKVIDGMDTVHKIIEGDQITDVQIIK